MTLGSFVIAVAMLAFIPAFVYTQESCELLNCTAAATPSPPLIREKTEANFEYSGLQGSYVIDKVGNMIFTTLTLNGKTLILNVETNGKNLKASASEDISCLLKKVYMETEIKGSETTFFVETNGCGKLKLPP